MADHYSYKPEGYRTDYHAEPSAYSETANMPMGSYGEPAAYGGMEQDVSGSMAPLPVVGDTTPVEVKLFVGRVPRSYDEDGVKPIFEEYGAVLEVAIIRDKQTGVHKGSAFVRMQSVTQADRAIRDLHNTKILDAAMGPLQVKYAQGEPERLGLNPEAANPAVDQAKLFVGSLTKQTDEADVMKVFQVFGKVDEVFVLKDMQTGIRKGCAFVKFAFKEQAIQAIQGLNGLYTFVGASRPAEVRFAESKQQKMNMQMTNPLMARYAYNQTTPTTNSNANPRQMGAWKEYFTQDGRPYYHNEETSVTTWDKPTEFDKLTSDVTGPPGANVFVFHVPNEWGQAELLRHFGDWGHILSARVAVDKTTGRNKGYAFVSYDN
ncbi:MAG: hypothetical protein KVP17_003603, partial [Porospora cf. gigantea B]|uniref:uncharacterized protein n=2 Tax=Porospora cf. gigantea B TaxID=2853592 RepID=UPI003571D7D2